MLTPIGIAVWLCIGAWMAGIFSGKKGFGDVANSLTWWFAWPLRIIQFLGCLVGDLDSD